MICKKVISQLNDKLKEQLRIKQTVETFYKNPNNEFGTKLLERLKTIIRHLSHDSSIDVRWGAFMGGSYMDSQNNRIVFDPALLPSDVPDLTEGLMLLYFVSAHEVVHKLITRYDQYIQEMGLTGYFEQLGLGTLCNAVEDPRDNDYMKAHNPGSKRYYWIVSKDLRAAR